MVRPVGGAAVSFVTAAVPGGRVSCGLIVRHARLTSRRITGHRVRRCRFAVFVFFPFHPTFFRWRESIGVTSPGIVPRLHADPLDRAAILAPVQLGVKCDVGSGL